METILQSWLLAGEFLMTVVQDVPALGPDTKDDTFASSFGIKTTDTFNVGDNDLVGMGQLDNNNQVVAVATVSTFVLVISLIHIICNYWSTSGRRSTSDELSIHSNRYLLRGRNTGRPRDHHGR